MASIQLPATMENLPTDALSNIFIRLVAKQLAQLRCVSKSWNALLSQPSFVKSHLHHSIRNNDAILLFFYEIYNNLTAPFSVHPSRSPHLELNNFIKLPFNFRTEGARIGGSVHGLICLYYGFDNCYNVRIWNPSLSAVTTLPPHSVPSHDYDPINILFRFGFDPTTDDYKVIKLAGVMDPRMIGLMNISFSMVKEWLPVEVYSMRKGTWKVITQRFPSHITGLSRQDKVCVDGLIHWLGFIGENRKLQTIVAFDLGVERFIEIPLPVCMLDQNVSNHVNVLGVLGGKLCVMSSVRAFGGKCEVWVMDEYGKPESWAKHHVFSQFSGKIDPYGFTLQNEFFFLKKKMILMMVV